MQSLAWYVERLRAMSPEEVIWRLRSILRGVLDRPRFALGLYPSLRLAPLSDGREPGFRVSDVEVGEWASLPSASKEAAWSQALVARAEQLARCHLSFFTLKDRDLCNPVDWNRDHESGKKAPLHFAASIDYRDRRVTGDAKVVWEPNRHHHLVVLGRAYRASGEGRYAAAVVEQLESWLHQCPFGKGMNWRSPLELAIRLINWVWAIDLIQESGLWGGEFRRRTLHAVYLHLWEVTRKYSRGSSANNHRIGEAAGVFIAASYFRDLPGTLPWREESREILCQEIIEQTYPDGCSRELALGYHLFVLQFFLFAGVVARKMGEDFPVAYWSRLEKMLEFIGALSEGGIPLPMLGDCDDGYVLDLGSAHGDVRGLLSIGATLFGRPDFKAWAGGYAEPTWWLLGRSSLGQFGAIPPPAEETLTSRAFPESGHYLLQCGRKGARDCVSVVFDCGALGFKSIAAHGHADALSFTLRAFGKEVFVDPGTYDYFSFPAWRDYFRSTRAHNTVVVDDTDQSEMLGPFIWGARAQARCIAWEPRGQGGKVTGEHDGYMRLADPVLHRRTLDLNGESRVLTIRDEIITHGRHEAAVYFHLAEDCVVSEVGPGRYEVTVGGVTATLTVDPQLSTQMLKGSEEPIRGWVSRGYHRKNASTTIIGHGACQGETHFVSQVEIGPPP